MVSVIDAVVVLQVFSLLSAAVKTSEGPPVGCLFCPAVVAHARFTVRDQEMRGYDRQRDHLQSKNNVRNYRSIFYSDCKEHSGGGDAA
jgi:hypothetical protein